VRRLNGATKEADGMHFSRILVTTDFSATSNRALQYALSLARHHKSQIYLAHIIPEQARATDQAVPSSELLNPLRRAAEEAMTRVLRAIPAGMSSIVNVVEEGKLWVTIERLINKYKDDLIVAGTHREVARPEPFLGSGAEQILRHSTCPVLMIGPAIEEEDLGEIEFKNIPFVTDFGPSPLRAGAYAFSLAREFDAQITILHVAEDPVASGEAVRNHLRRIHIQRMEHALSAKNGSKIKADFSVRFGTPADEVLSAARAMHADLVVIGAKPGGGWAGPVPLSTAYNVVARASCPVLTVRA
jgi:nucleotide-binding universal stress UspA family protein